VVESRIEQYQVVTGGDRLDKDIATRNPDLSRSAVQRLIEEGQILVNKEAKRASYILRPGDCITIHIPAPQPAELQPEDLPLDIVYEDEAILVINKAPGMVVHPGAGNLDGTLVNAILAHCPDLKGVGGVLRPGIVHRLDKETSGIIVVAKDDAAIHHLQRQFKERTVVKKYIALLVGRLTQANGIIDAPIGRHRVHRQRMAVTANGKIARTRWEIAGRYLDEKNQPYTLVNIDLLTGRTHQIRVHFSWLGYPLVGDEVYGPAKGRLTTPRQFLHAASLILRHPSSDQVMVFSAPLPEDLTSVLKHLRQEGE
jgi:23S rRNA pseudouridine1911/1915/1917 synthase